MDGFKFKHLKAFSENKVDYAYLMKELLGYNNRKFFRKYVFKHYFKKTYSLVKDIEGIDIAKIEFKKDNPIKIPNQIDDISYIAMMEIQSILKSDLNALDTILEVLIRVCYKAYFKKDYKQNNKRFIQLKDKLENSDFKDVIGLYNKVIKELNEKNDFWNKRFVEVEVIDEDYIRADNGIMSQFNIIETLKGLCNDFNCTIDQAWQLPYSFVQTNNLAKASKNFVQDNLRLIKESKMRSLRK